MFARTLSSLPLKAILVLVVLSVIGTVIWVRSPPDSTREEVYAAYADAGKLDFRFFPEVSWIADFFTFGTPFGHRYSINHLSELENNVAILLIDTSEEESEGIKLPYWDSTKSQCISLPRELLILCDALLLDSIPSEPPLATDIIGVPRPPLLMQWIIGHELAHILLEHGTERDGMMAFTGLSENAVTTPHFRKQPAASSVANCESDTTEIDNGLFALEAEADRYVVERLRGDASVDAMLHLGGMAQLALWQWAEEVRLQSEDRIVVPYSTDQHPPFLFRIISFFSEAERIYEEISFPALLPRLDWFCLTPGKGLQKKRNYFFDGTYIDEPRSSTLEQELLELLERSQRLASERRIFEVPVSNEDTADLAEPCDGSSDPVCFSKVLDRMITSGLCPPRERLNEILLKAGGRLDRSSDWSLLVASYQQFLQAVQCAGKGTLNLDDVFFSFERLMNIQSNVLTAESVEIVIESITRQDDRKSRIDGFRKLSDTLNRLAWFDDAARVLGLAVDELNQEDLQEEYEAFRLGYRIAIFRFRGRELNIDSRVEIGMSVFDAALALAVKTGPEDSEINEAISNLAPQVLSTAVFMLNTDGRFEEALELQASSTPKMDGIIGITDNGRLMLLANEITSNSALRRPMDPVVFDLALELTTARAEEARSRGDLMEVDDAARGLLALTAWAYISEDETRCAEAAKHLVEFWVADPEKTIDGKFEGISTIGDGRTIDILDAIRCVPYQPEAYDLWETKGSIDWRWQRRD